MDILDYYKKLVEFLGLVLGEGTEVVLRDCRKPAHDIIAIANGHVSGRTIGAPITDFTLSILANDEWKEKDYVVNYIGKANPGKVLRSSTFFIREKGKLVGELCVNVDTTPFRKLMEEISRMGGLDLLPEQNDESVICSAPVENFSNDGMKDMMERAVIKVIGSGEAVVRERLTQEDRLQIINELNHNGLFQIKGAVSEAAEYLYCSEASVYRYLSKLNRNN